MASVATLKVNMVANYSNLASGVNGAKKKLSSFEKSVTALRANVISAFASMGGAMAFSSALNSTAKFEKNIALISTMLNEQTMKYLPTYKKEIQSMAITFGQSTDTLSFAMYQILSATVDASKAMGVLNVSVKAAIGGFTETAVAADAITSLLNSYGMAAAEATDVADMLFMTVKRGKITFAEIASDIGKVAVIAATANISLEELGAGISTLTRAGLPADIAITALRTLLTSILKPAADADKAMQELNTGLKLNAETVKEIGLGGVLETLKNAPPEMLARLAPQKRELVALLAIIKQIEGYQEDVNLQMNNGGAAAEAYEKMMHNLDIALKQARQSLEFIGRVLITSVRPALILVAKLMKNSFVRAVIIVVAHLLLLKVAMKQLVMVCTLLRWRGIHFLIGAFGKIHTLVARLIVLVLRLAGTFTTLTASMASGMVAQMGYVAGTKAITAALIAANIAAAALIATITLGAIVVAKLGWELAKETKRWWNASKEMKRNVQWMKDARAGKITMPKPMAAKEAAMEKARQKKLLDEQTALRKDAANAVKEYSKELRNLQLTERQAKMMEFGGYENRQIGKHYDAIQAVKATNALLEKNKQLRDDIQNFGKSSIDTEITKLDQLWHSLANLPSFREIDTNDMDFNKNFLGPARSAILEQIALYDELDRAAKRSKALEETKRKFEKLKDTVNSIKDSLKTPFEKMEEFVETLLAGIKNNLLTIEQAMAAIKMRASEMAVPGSMPSSMGSMGTFNPRYQFATSGGQGQSVLMQIKNINADQRRLQEQGNSILRERL